MSPHFGKLLIAAGLLIVAVGVLVLLADKLPFAGKLPGDVVWKWKNTTVYIPIATMLVLSILFTIMLNIFSRWK